MLAAVVRPMARWRLLAFASLVLLAAIPRSGQVGGRVPESCALPDTLPSKALRDRVPSCTS
jgi:hypothetical protein